jgi:glycosyltransferase involved in cell wall biosynthesis
MFVSIIIPTFNGGDRIAGTLEAVVGQTTSQIAEILVVNDGSTDNTAEVVARYPKVRLINQSNAGPAAARNRGALEARGMILLFTDDDCVPLPGWLNAMIEPFEDRDVVGVKGVYRTCQRQVVARFVQIEYEDKYRLMWDVPEIDFIDTYSAGFRRERFLEMNGYDTSFPVACAEDVELSYRMSERGWSMKFVPNAAVYHRHPNTLWAYLKKKYKFAFWRVMALRKNPNKVIRDSHTPQLMKLQLLLPLALLLATFFDTLIHKDISATLLVSVAFLITTLPFTLRAIALDPLVGLLSPLLLALRACAQFLGVTGGLIHAWRTLNKAATESPA